MSLRDLVGAQNCGGGNAIANLANMQNAANAQMGEAKMYGGVDKNMMGGPMNAGPDMLMGQHKPMQPEARNFANAFQEGPEMMGPRVGPMGPMFAPQHHRPMQQQDPNAMLNEFKNLNMENQVDFDRLYNESKGPAAHHWAQQFNSQPGGMHMEKAWNMQQMGHAPPQMMQQQRQFIPQMMMQQPGYGMNMQMMQRPMMNPVMMQQPRMAQSTVVQDITNEEKVATVSDVPKQEMADPVAAPDVSMGMGMDKAMIEKLRNSDDPKWKNSKFLQFIDKINKGELEFKDNQVVERQPQASPWMQEHAGEIQAAQGQEWANEFSNSQDWAEMYKNAQQDQFWNEDVPEEKTYASYQFQDDNKQMDNSDPFAEGIRLFEAGKVKEAILCFEAAVKKDVDNAEAWRYLGQAQAENEDESNAIAALLKCIEIDPYNLPALMMLGVSYTNDLEERRALKYLKTWLEHHPDYQDADLAEQHKRVNEYEQFYSSEDNDQSSYDNNLHDQVTHMFLKAAELNSDDADVHTVLGVLYHISNDFDKAIDSFRNSVKLAPEDPQLWNKLGATLANSSRSSQAVHAYKRALELRPTYVRALANLAISYANQNMHKEAARTYLAVLAQNDKANHVWSYLRISLARMGEDQLVEMARVRDLSALRKNFGL